MKRFLIFVFILLTCSMFGQVKLRQLERDSIKFSVPTPKDQIIIAGDTSYSQRYIPGLAWLDSLGVSGVQDYYISNDTLYLTTTDSTYAVIVPTSEDIRVDTAYEGVNLGFFSSSGITIKMTNGQEFLLDFSGVLDLFLNDIGTDLSDRNMLFAYFLQWDNMFGGYNPVTVEYRIRPKIFIQETEPIDAGSYNDRLYPGYVWKKLSTGEVFQLSETMTWVLISDLVPNEVDLDLDPNNEYILEDNIIVNGYMTRDDNLNFSEFTRFDNAFVPNTFDYTKSGVNYLIDQSFSPYAVGSIYAFDLFIDEDYIFVLNSLSQIQVYSWDNVDISSAVYLHTVTSVLTQSVFCTENYLYGSAGTGTINKYLKSEIISNGPTFNLIEGISIGSFPTRDFSILNDKFLIRDPSSNNVYFYQFTDPDSLATAVPYDTLDFSTTGKAGYNGGIDWLNDSLFIYQNTIADSIWTFDNNLNLISSNYITDQPFGIHIKDGVLYIGEASGVRTIRKYNGVISDTVYVDDYEVLDSNNYYKLSADVYSTSNNTISFGLEDENGVTVLNAASADAFTGWKRLSGFFKPNSVIKARPFLIGSNLDSIKNVRLYYYVNEFDSTNIYNVVEGLENDILWQDMGTYIRDKASTKVSVSDAGRLGIGVAVPTATFEVNTTDAYPAIFKNGSNNLTVLNSFGEQNWYFPSILGMVGIQRYSSSPSIIFADGASYNSNQFYIRHTSTAVNFGYSTIGNNALILSSDNTVAIGGSGLSAKVLVDPDGDVHFHDYGLGTKTGTETNLLGVDILGKVIEVELPETPLWQLNTDTVENKDFWNRLRLDEYGKGMYNEYGDAVITVNTDGSFNSMPIENFDLDRTNEFRLEDNYIELEAFNWTDFHKEGVEFVHTPSAFLAEGLTVETYRFNTAPVTGMLPLDVHYTDSLIYMSSVRDIAVYDWDGSSINTITLRHWYNDFVSYQETSIYVSDDHVYWFDYTNNVVRRAPRNEIENGTWAGTLETVADLAGSNIIDFLIKGDKCFILDHDIGVEIYQFNDWLDFQNMTLIQTINIASPKIFANSSMEFYKDDYLMITSDLTDSLYFYEINSGDLVHQIPVPNQVHSVKDYNNFLYYGATNYIYKSAFNVRDTSYTQLPEKLNTTNYYKYSVEIKGNNVDTVRTGIATWNDGDISYQWCSENLVYDGWNSFNLIFKPNAHDSIKPVFVIADTIRVRNARLFLHQIPQQELDINEISKEKIYDTYIENGFLLREDNYNFPDFKYDTLDFEAAQTTYLNISAPDINQSYNVTPVLGFDIYEDRLYTSSATNEKVFQFTDNDISTSTLVYDLGDIGGNGYDICVDSIYVYITTAYGEIWKYLKSDIDNNTVTTTEEIFNNGNNSANLGFDIIGDKWMYYEQASNLTIKKFTSYGQFEGSVFIGVYNLATLGITGINDVGFITENIIYAHDNLSDVTYIVQLEPFQILNSISFPTINTTLYHNEVWYGHENTGTNTLNSYIEINRDTLFTELYEKLDTSNYYSYSIEIEGNNVDTIRTGIATWLDGNVSYQWCTGDTLYTGWYRHELDFKPALHDSIKPVFVIADTTSIRNVRLFLKQYQSETFDDSAIQTRIDSVITVVDDHKDTDLDIDPNNEFQDLTFASNILGLTNSAVTFDLSGYLDNTDAQDISTSGAAGNITIDNGSTLNLNVNDADASITNEGVLSMNTDLANTTFSINSNSSGSVPMYFTEETSVTGNNRAVDLERSGNAITFNLKDADELETVTISAAADYFLVWDATDSDWKATTISNIPGDGTGTDDQTLSIVSAAAGTISIESGNTIDLTTLVQNQVVQESTTVGTGFDLSGYQIVADFNEFTTDAIPEGDEFIIMYDVSGVTHEKIDIDDLATYIGSGELTTVGTGLSLAGYQVNPDFDAFTQDNTFSGTDEVVYLSFTTHKRGTLAGLGAYMQANWGDGTGTDDQAIYYYLSGSTPALRLDGTSTGMEFDAGEGLVSSGFEEGTLDRILYQHDWTEFNVLSSGVTTSDYLLVLDGTDEARMQISYLATLIGGADGNGLWNSSNSNTTMASGMEPRVNNYLLFESATEAPLFYIDDAATDFMAFKGTTALPHPVFGSADVSVHGTFGSSNDIFSQDDIRAGGDVIAGGWGVFGGFVSVGDLTEGPATGLVGYGSGNHLTNEITIGDNLEFTGSRLNVLTDAEEFYGADPTPSASDVNITMSGTRVSSGAGAGAVSGGNIVVATGLYLVTVSFYAEQGQGIVAVNTFTGSTSGQWPSVYYDVGSSKVSCSQSALVDVTASGTLTYEVDAISGTNEISQFEIIFIKLSD